MDLHQPQDHELIIERVASHRNGMFGQGFHVVKFRDLDNDKYLGIVFPEPGHIAVFDRDLLAEDKIDFTVNSWRGDEYEQGLRQAVADFERAQTLLPSEKWHLGWSPNEDPIPDDAAEIPGNAAQATAILTIVEKVITPPKKQRGKRQ